MENWIAQNTRRRCFRRLLAWGFASLCIISLGVWQQRYVINFVQGPYSLGPLDIASITNIDEEQHYFATVTGSKAVDTGLQHITIRKRSGVETGRDISTYYALLVGDKFLLYRSSEGPKTTVEGQLIAMPAEVERSLFSAPDMQGVRNVFYSLYISNDSFRLPGYFAFAALIIFLFCAYKYALSDWRYFQDVTLHSTVKNSYSWGDPLSISVEIERESRLPRYRCSGWLITDNYLIISTFFNFDVLRLTDLLWAYKKVTRHSVNFIPTGKTYEALLACYGGAATIKGREKTVDAILGFAASRTPWAVFGYTKEIENLFKKNTRDFCVAVEQRKRELMQKTSS
jgi:hypothetical protein